MDDIVAAVKTCLNKYADFKGRAARPEFWWFVLANILAVVVVSLVSTTLANLVALGLLVPMLAVGTRRLHDLGKTGWLQLLALIPLIGSIILLYWSTQPGQPGPNEFGEPPVSAPAGVPVVPGQQ